MSSKLTDMTKIRKAFPKMDSSRKLEYFGKNIIKKITMNLKVGAHNKKKLTAHHYSRLELFTEDEKKKKLSALPQECFKIKYPSFVTVMQNGHVSLSVDKNFYSVTFQYLRKKVKLLYTKSTIAFYYNYNHIATHPRHYKPYVYTTIPDHMANIQHFVSDISTFHPLHILFLL